MLILYIQQNKWLRSCPFKLRIYGSKGILQPKKKSLQEELNVIPDELALDYALHPHPKHRSHHLPLPPPDSAVRLCYDGSVITSKLYSVLSSQLHTPSLIQCIQRKANWSPRVFHMVDWEAHGSAFHRLSRQQKIFTVKLIHQLLNTQTSVHAVERRREHWHIY